MPLRTAREPSRLELVVLVVDHRAADHGERVEVPGERRRGIGRIAQALHAVHRVDDGDERITRGAVRAARGGGTREQEQEHGTHGAVLRCWGSRNVHSVLTGEVVELRARVGRRCSSLASPLARRAAGPARGPLRGASTVIGR